MATQQWKHHVFISFRGEDTRHNFVCHLYDALSGKGLKTFVDDQLRRGEEINNALLQAIQDSKVALIIFSENYASSSWCLDELLKIIECYETHDQIVIPVFYGVTPSNVRRQNGRFGESFAKHIENRRYSNKTRKWKDALTKAANKSGWDSDVIREDNKLIVQIVRDVLEKLKLLYPCSLEDFVGLDSKISQVKKLLATGSSDVRMLGIWGMGGIGKTTIAETIFDEVSSQFEGRCFVRNVREVSEKEGILKLLQQLISELLEERDVKMDTKTIKPALRERLKRKSVFVVFDDVSDRLQLKDLTGNQCWFGAGSNIIITSRDKKVINGITDNIYEVEALSDVESRQLFVRNAFQGKQPSLDHNPLIDSFVNYARGNPLAITVLGSYVCGEGVELWKDALNKLSKGPNQKIQNVLKLSYDGLDREEQAIFLHIACFFKGENVNEAKRIFKSCRLSADFGVSRLVGKSLVTSRYNKLDMHDLLQDMGREIVRQESNNPRRCSRLWDAEEIRDVFEENEQERSAGNRYSGTSSMYEGSGSPIREEPPSYSSSVMQRYESFENPLASEERASSGNPQLGTALYDFSAGLDDELSLIAGEEVEIEYEVDGWFYVSMKRAELNIENNLSFQNRLASCHYYVSHILVSTALSQLKKKRPGRDGKMSGLVPVLYVNPR